METKSPISFDLKKHKMTKVYEDDAVFIETNIVPTLEKVYDFKYMPENDSSRKYNLSEYLGSDYVYLANINNRTVGHYCFSLHKNFTQSFNLMYEIEVDILPEYQNLQIAKTLRKFAVSDFTPDIIYGEAANPISAKSRNSSLKEHYLTFWINQLITQTEITLTENDIKLVNEISKQCINVFDPENYNLSENGIKPYTHFEDYIEEYSKYNKIAELKPLFEKLVSFSNKHLHGKVSMGVLLSFKHKLFPHIQYDS
jgi:hypothetical protein